MIRCVFFDAAGTLLEVAEPVGKTYARFARRHGLAVEAAALEATGSRAGETLHVGDSERLDLRAARAAGLAALRLDRGGGPAPDTITDLAEVAEHLTR